jgi:hypothetical protein
MKIISKKKGTGKTTELIKIAAADGGMIVCHNINECRRIQKQAIELELNIRFPITYFEFMDESFRGSQNHLFHIDNVEMFLSSITTHKIKTITITTIK